MENLSKLALGPNGSKIKIWIQRGQCPMTVDVERKFRITDEKVLEEIIKAQVDRGIQRRDPQEIKKVFEEFAINEKGNQHIPVSKLRDALHALDIVVPGSADENKFLDKLDTDKSGKLELNEFQEAILASCTPLEEWVKSWPLAQLLADSIPRFDDDHGHSEDNLTILGLLDDKQLELVVRGFSYGLAKMLLNERDKLRDAVKMEESVEYKQAEKFEVSEMKCGRIEKFYDGLAARIGSAHVDFESAIQLEHESETMFRSSNYDVETSPKKEWTYVCMPGQEYPKDQRQGGRTIKNVDDLMKEKASTSAKLIRAEVIGVVLYTGPMFGIYNAALRQFPEDKYAELKSAHNLYTTTIFVLASAVQNLSRVTKIEPGMRLYRGISADVELPKLLNERDEHGCTGFTEWGFMSTTVDMKVALRYSKAEKSIGLKRRSTLLVITAGSVDRGADIRAFSQYPHENEILFVPCSFVERFGHATIHVEPGLGIVDKVPVKVNANLKTATVEELMMRRKTMHISAFDHEMKLLERRLKKIAERDNAEARMEKDHSARIHNLKVSGFLDRIIEQCNEVRSRHDAAPIQVFNHPGELRKLVIERMDVLAMAACKLKLWLRNEKVLIGFHWSSPLRTTHRRWTKYLAGLCHVDNPEKVPSLIESQEQMAQQQKNAMRLCKALGLSTSKKMVDNTNELKETKLMSTAAEGGRGQVLRAIALAGASVNEERSDGVTAMWLAAEFGHSKCVSVLASMKADVNHSSNSGATPIYMAARNGHVQCIKSLVKLSADVNKRDLKGAGPLYQAAVNGHADCITALVECNAEINSKATNFSATGSYPVHEAARYGHYDALLALIKGSAEINVTDGNKRTPWNVASECGHDKCVKLISNHGGKGSSDLGSESASHEGRKTLIVSTGDISDIDGFFALSEYAKTGADVVFVMNYPAYINVKEDKEDTKFDVSNPGLGYKYDARRVHESTKAMFPQAKEYIEFMDSYTDNSSSDLVDHNDRMKRALTDLAFAMAKKVWEEVESSSKGALMFCIGGINSINPFSETNIKNEVLVYSRLIRQPLEKLEPIQGHIYDSLGKQCSLHWTEYSQVYMDFNGSMAFWSGHLATDLSSEQIVKKIKGAFIMGGVYSETLPVTMPSIPGVLNRFSSATMNQLYHPQHTADFFAFLKQFQIPTWTISNNAVQDRIHDDEGIAAFLSSNGLEGGELKALALAHYNSPYKMKPPKKPYDYYCSLALTSVLNSEKPNETFSSVNPVLPMADKVKESFSLAHVCKTRTLFHSNVYGITFLSHQTTWEATRAEYVETVKTASLLDGTDNDQIRSKKEYFRKEVELMKTIDHLASLTVRDVSFSMDPDTKKVTIV
eukprot:CAMPEP_0172202078 /NCGR_PEP_ID=MMETSP1050-20130122/30413_1 /TAXON_ID=233186 /ORGANISM="Cryptomonas curvata, Strain CCAP979/52" /LENGTH=1356 /DNA_ID=CAMNT_0012879911 /DNA_START=122 /DNA_END=4192 /DNA_ORIENTATION=+